MMSKLTVETRRPPWWLLILPANIIILAISYFLLIPHMRTSCPIPMVVGPGRGIRATATVTRYIGPTDVAAKPASASTRTQLRTTYTRPPMKIVALLFVGRKRYMEVLECYIKRNLVANGGWLDEVIWLINTNDETDIAYIRGVVTDNPEYRAQFVGHADSHYGNAYQGLRGDTLYVKIDDDVVFIEDNAIPAIVSRLYENDDLTLVSANVINQPAFSFVHYHLNAIKPYVPELSKPRGYDENARVKDWRPSADPLYSGNPKKLKSDMAETPPYPNHRWLRLKRDADIEHTPCGVLGKDGGKEYAAFNVALGSWAIAAQEHYSFLENLEKDELWRYGGFDSWNYHYERLSINFIAFRGQTIIDNPPPELEDEVFLTMDLTKKLEKPAVLDGAALVVHFNFGPQTERLGSTDLLGRYALFAEQNVCGKRWGTSMNASAPAHGRR